MRTRLLTAITVTLLAVPLASAHAAPQHKCEKAMGAEHKCDKGGKG